MEQDGFTDADHALRNKEIVFKRVKETYFSALCTIGARGLFTKVLVNKS